MNPKTHLGLAIVILVFLSLVFPSVGIRMTTVEGSFFPFFPSNYFNSVGMPAFVTFSRSLMSEFRWRCNPMKPYNNKLHGAEPFLRSRQLCSYSRTSQHVTEPEGSLPCSQGPTTSPYPEPDRSSSCHPHPISLRSILILCTHLCLGLPSGLFWLPHQNPTCIPLLPIRATCPTYRILLDLTILIILGEEYKL
jgi:hypothetical protein